MVIVLFLMRGRMVDLHPLSHDRNWRPEVAVMPRAVIDGDGVRLTGVRNFDYRSRNDFTVRYEEREVSAVAPDRPRFLRSYLPKGRSDTRS